MSKDHRLVIDRLKTKNSSAKTPLLHLLIIKSDCLRVPYCLNRWYLEGDWGCRLIWMLVWEKRVNLV